MDQRLSRKRDLDTRLRGAALLLLAATLLALFVVPGHRAASIVAGPSVREFCVVLVAVCAGSFGAAMLCVGRALFEPVPQPPIRRSVGGDSGQGAQ